MTYYADGKRTGTFMARELRGHPHKPKILFIHHPVTQVKLYNPKDIAEAFSLYYGLLYNLKEDNTILQSSS